MFVEKSHKWSLAGCLLLLLLAATSVSAAPTVLNVWLNTQSTKATEVMRTELIPAFEKLYPDIKIEFTPVTWQTRNDKLRIGFAGGVAPDVMEIGADTILDDTKMGYPLAIDNRVAAWSARKDFIPEAWLPTKWEGQQYGVPFTLTGRHLFYLTSVFEEVGLDANRPPSTWELIKEYTQKLNKLAGDGKTERLGFYWGWPQMQSLFFYLWQNKAEIVNEADGTALFNTPEGVETLEFLKEIYQMQGPPVNLPAFNARGQGIRYNATHGDANSVRNSSVELYNELRLFSIERKGSTVWPMYVNSLAITRECKNADAAWTFITWLSQIENATKYLAAASILSPNMKAFSTPYVQETMKAIKGVYAEANFARRTFIFPTTLVKSPLESILTKVINNELSPKEGLTQIEFEWNKVRDTYYKK